MMEFLVGSMLVLLVVIVCRITYVTHFQENYSSLKKSKNKSVKLGGLAAIPGPKALPFIGNLLQLPKPDNILRKCFEWCSKYGSVFRVTVFGRNYVVIANATVAQAVLQSNEDGHLGKTDVYKIIKELKGLAFTSGERWRSLRKLATPAFGYKNIESRILHTAQNADNLVANLQEHFSTNDTHDKHLVENYIATCAVSIVIDSFITGPDCSSFEETMSYVQNWKRYTELITYRMLHPWLAIDFLWKLHPLHTEYQYIVRQLNKFADNLLVNHISKSQKGVSPQPPEIHNSNSQKGMFVAELINAGYSEDEVHAEILSMLFGYEAFFLGLLYFLYLLAIHPEHQKKCLDEVNSAFHKEQTWTAQTLTELKHLERCFMEALRMFPPAFIYGRRLTSDLIIQDDILLPSGTNIFILPLVMHKNPEYYPEPDTFDPDRFLPENYNKRPAYSFLPFSSGPRVCLGMKPAIASVKIITAQLLRNFIVQSDDKLENLELHLSLGMVPKNAIDLKFTPRKSGTDSFSNLK